MAVKSSTFDKFSVPFFIERQKSSSNFGMPSNHYHNAYEIYYLLEGERFYFIKDKIYHIKKGDLVIIDTYELHKTIDAGVPVVERILINFKYEALSYLFQQNQALELLSCFQKRVNVLKLDSQEQSFIHGLLFKMLAESRNSSAESMLYLKLLLTELLIFLCRRTAQNTEIPQEHTNPLHEKVSEIAGYINENYSHRLTLASLSEAFFLSSFYLSRIFKEVTGFSFVEYLNNVRTRQACRLLAESSLNITEIAEKVGYDSITHFGRTFKSIVGVSPKAYRKQYKLLYINQLL